MIPRRRRLEYILEAQLDPRRGIEAMAILTKGTLHFGDAIHTSSAKGKVKILENFLGKAERTLTPSAPALIIGFETLPKIGEEFFVGAETGAPHTAANNFEGPKERRTGANKETSEFNLILKASDAGSLEAIGTILNAVGKEKHFSILAQSVGNITDGDVRMAAASKAAIAGFKVKPNNAARILAEGQGVTILSSEIIYELIQAVEDFLRAPDKGIALGELDVLAVFNQKKLEKQVVGGKVANGVMRVKANFEISEESYSRTRTSYES